MKTPIRSTTLFVLFAVLFTTTTPMTAGDVDDKITVKPNDWPWWRGPNRNGIAADQDIPLEWSETKNVLWKVNIPGRGHASATIVGDQAFLPTADHDRNLQLILCFDRNTGDKIWEQVVHSGGITKKGNKKASQASSSIACDGRRLYACFLSHAAIHTTALDLAGKILWQEKVSDYVVHQGYASSPALYRDLVIVSSDNKGKSGGKIAAFHRTTGKLAWSHSRPSTPNYASPSILHASGRDQVVFTGCDLVTSFDPGSGDKLWEIKGATTECVTTTVTDGTHIYTSGGYPKNHVSAVRADGSGKLVWENKSRVYVPSMLVHKSHLYMMLDAGVAACCNSSNGEELWKKRIGGTFSSSPIVVNGNILVTDEAGTTSIFKATPDAFQMVGQNKLGDEVFATPAICGGRIFTRVAFHRDGKRQEVLFCLGKK